jgi:hypothetical protein
VCGAQILLGEPWGVAPYTGDTACGACTTDLLFVNGDATETEVACVRLRHDLSALQEERALLLHRREELEETIELLRDLTHKDICPPRVSRALELLLGIECVFPREESP